MKISTCVNMNQLLHWMSVGAAASRRTWFLAMSLLVMASPGKAAAQPSAIVPASWIAAPNSEPCPVNRFYYFRKEVELRNPDGDLTLHVAADSNAHIWINGKIARRKVTRYFERSITTEKIDARRFLHPGINTVVILNHSWGPITTFQRSGCTHAGVFVSSSWLRSDDTWKVRPAKEFLPNTKQIVGVHPEGRGNGDQRIRFAQFVDGQQMPAVQMFGAHFDDSSWSQVAVVKDGPWPEQPTSVETPGQREEPVAPILLLAQGRVTEKHFEENNAVAIENEMLHATYEPQGKQAVALRADHGAHTLNVTGRAGETRYVTFDFGKPVHGFPFLAGTAAGTEPVIDFAYGEVNHSLLTGEFLVKDSGWLNPEAIVGKGYIDRYYARQSAQRFEMPDERTARWWTIHIYFPQAGSFLIEKAGFIRSQYPADIKGSFHCGNKRVDEIVRLSMEHAIVSMSDTYVDTPGREDGQWLEDARLRAQLSAQWLGDVRLRQVLLRLAAQSQRPDGHLHPFPPSNYPITANADWAAEWVGALYDDYMWTGETTRVRAYWPEVTKWWGLVLSKVDAEGLWRDPNVFADIRIGTHASAGQSSGIASAQIIQRLALSIEMAKAIGDDEQADAWTKMHSRLVEAFAREHLVQAANGIPLHVDDVADTADAGVKRGFSQAAQAMAIEGGLLTREQAAADLDYAFTAPDGAPGSGVDRWNNPTYLYRSLNALTLSGDSTRAMQHLLERFGPYLPGDSRNASPLILQGPWGGPLPEYWISREDVGVAAGELNPAQPSDPTGSHGWNAVALVWLHDSLLGVRIVEPGGGVLRIKPDAAGLSYVEGDTMTPKGIVFVSWRPAAQTLSIHLPAQVTANVELPPQLSKLDDSHELRIPSQCERSDLHTYSCSGTAIQFRRN